VVVGGVLLRVRSDQTHICRICRRPVDRKRKRLLCLHFIVRQLIFALIFDARWCAHKI